MSGVPPPKKRTSACRANRAPWLHKAQGVPSTFPTSVYRAESAVPFINTVSTSCAQVHLHILLTCRCRFKSLQQQSHASGITLGSCCLNCSCKGEWLLCMQTSLFFVAPSGLVSLSISLSIMITHVGDLDPACR